MSKFKLGLVALLAIVFCGYLQSQGVGGGGIQRGSGGGGTSGTYTPVLSNSNNVASMTVPGPWQYTRVGNVVTYSGALSITVTANGLSTDLHGTLPVTTAIASAFQLAGVCSPGSGTQTSTANTSFEAPGFHVVFTSTDAAGHTWSCTGSYLVI